MLAYTFSHIANISVFTQFWDMQQHGGFFGVLTPFWTHCTSVSKNSFLVLYGSVQTYFSISKHSMDLVLIPKYFSEIVNKLYYLCVSSYEYIFIINNLQISIPIRDNFVFPLSESLHESSLILMINLYCPDCSFLCDTSQK